MNGRILLAFIAVNLNAKYRLLSGTKIICFAFLQLYAFNNWIGYVKTLQFLFMIRLLFSLHLLILSPWIVLLGVRENRTIKNILWKYIKDFSGQISISKLWIRSKICYGSSICNKITQKKQPFVTYFMNCNTLDRKNV